MSYRIEIRWPDPADRLNYDLHFFYLSDEAIPIGPTTEYTLRNPKKFLKEHKIDPNLDVYHMDVLKLKFTEDQIKEMLYLNKIFIKK